MKLGYKVVKNQYGKYTSSTLALTDERTTEYIKNSKKYTLPKITGTPLFVYERPYGYVVPYHSAYELWEVEYFYYPPAYTSYNCITTEKQSEFMRYAYRATLAPEEYFQLLWSYAVSCRWEFDLPEEDNIVLASAVRFIRQVK